MKHLLIIIHLVSLTAVGQLQKSDNGFYEYKIKSIQVDSLRNLLIVRNLAVDDNLNSYGSITHLVSGFAPIEIKFQGKMKGDEYVLTNFQLKGDPSDAWLHLEDVTQKKAMKKWIEINSKLVRFKY